MRWRLRVLAAVLRPIACSCAPAAAGDEQLEVEQYFRSAASLRTSYWISLEKVGNLYYWQDGQVVNNGNVSNAAPYAHFSYNFQVRSPIGPMHMYLPPLPAARLASWQRWAHNRAGRIVPTPC
jgi:hypothetical protein